VSIAAGAILINVVSYRLMLTVMAIVIGCCAIVLLVRPAPEPRAEPVPVAETEAAEAEKVS
jgi:hypothetical protein